MITQQKIHNGNWMSRVQGLNKILTINPFVQTIVWTYTFDTIVLTKVIACCDNSGAQ